MDIYMATNLQDKSIDYYFNTFTLQCELSVSDFDINKLICTGCTFTENNQFFIVRLFIDCFYYEEYNITTGEYLDSIYFRNLTGLDLTKNQIADLMQGKEVVKDYLNTKGQTIRLMIKTCNLRTIEP